jgi:epidermal growth factor receptor kinase substrate 8
MAQFRERRRNLEIVKTPEVYISQRSNPDEVQKWLKAKGFNEK